MSSPTTRTDPLGGAAIDVVDHDPLTRRRISIQLGCDVRDEQVDVDSASEALGDSPATVLVLGPSVAHPTELKKVEVLLLHHPHVGAILLVEELRTDVLQAAMRAGVKDVLTLPTDGAQLGEAVARVAGGLVSSVIEPEPAVPDPGPAGKVVTVFSTKGGAGKSVIATNLAVALKARTGGQVALVDADLQFGDTAVMLKLAPQHTVVDAVEAIDRLDPSLLQSLMARHEASGVSVLPAPVEPAFADQVGSAEMHRIVSTLRQVADFVVVDTPAYFNDVVLGLLEESDQIILVGGMDIPNIKNVKIGLQTLRLLNTPMAKVRLVLNRANSKVKLDVGEVERTLQLKADCLIPSDVVVTQTVNKGRPAVLDAPRSGVAKAIEGLADLLVDELG